MEGWKVVLSALRTALGCGAWSSHALIPQPLARQLDYNTPSRDLGFRSSGPPDSDGHSINHPTHLTRKWAGRASGGGELPEASAWLGRLLQEAREWLLG